MARTMYEAVIATQALPWARLGVARAQIEAGQAPAGRRTLESLIADQPGFADAYDVMGPRARSTRASSPRRSPRTAPRHQLTPGSIARLQRQGMLAFYLGEATRPARARTRDGAGHRLEDVRLQSLRAARDHAVSPTATRRASSAAWTT
jgi:hypothetical protein